MNTASTPSVKKKGKGLIILLAGAAIGLTAVAVVVSNNRSAGTYEDARDSVPQLFTNFKNSINDISRIEMRARGQDFIVARQEDGAWVMPNRYDYAVDTEKVRRILMNTSELEILERKTDNPDKLDKLGLKDVESETSDAVRVTFYNDKGAIVSNFIAGNKRKSGGYALYVRKESENQAYLVRGEGWSGLNIGPDYWLNASTFRLENSAVKGVTYMTGDGDEATQTLSFERAHTDARKFRVEGLPEGAEEDGSKVNASAFVIEELSLGGLTKDTDIPRDPEVPAMRTTFKTFAGYKMNIDTFGDREGDILARFSVELPEKSSDPMAAQAAKLKQAADGWLFVLTKEQAALLRPTPQALVKEEKKKEDKAE